MSEGHARGAVGWFLAAFVVCASIASAQVLPAQPSAAQKAAIQERLVRIRGELFTRADHVTENIRELKEILAVDPLIG